MAKPKRKKNGRTQEKISMPICRIEVSINFLNDVQCTSDIHVNKQKVARQAVARSGYPKPPATGRRSCTPEVGLTFFTFKSSIYKQLKDRPSHGLLSPRRGRHPNPLLEWIEKRTLAQFAICPLILRFLRARQQRRWSYRELHRTFNVQHPSIRLELETCRQEDSATRLSLLDLTINIGTVWAVRHHSISTPRKAKEAQ